MPGFDALYKQTVTLFNRKDVGGVTYWYVSVLSGVHLIIDRGIIISTYGEQATDNAKLHIQYSPTGDGGLITLANGTKKSYLKPKVFRATGNPDSNITFAFGDNFDFIMDGVFTEETLTATVKSDANVTASVSDQRWKKSRFGKTGTYVFVYNGSGWTYGGVAINLANIGVTVTGTPNVNDTITVKYVSSDGPICDNDYKSGFFNYMNKTYDNVFAITTVSKFNLIPHFEIAAK